MHVNHTLVSEPRLLDPYSDEGSGDTAMMGGHGLVPGSLGDHSSTRGHIVVRALGGLDNLWQEI